MNKTGERRLFEKITVCSDHGPLFSVFCFHYETDVMMVFLRGTLAIHIKLFRNCMLYRIDSGNKNFCVCVNY